MDNFEEEFVEKYINRSTNNHLKKEIEVGMLLIDLDKLSLELLDELMGSSHMFFIRIQKMRQSKVNKINQKYAD